MSLPFTSTESRADSRRATTLFAISAIVMVGLAAEPSALWAIDFEKMVMPGPLANAHEEFESDCSNCHRAFDADAQRILCLNCHELVESDISRQEGLHGRHPLASIGDCRSCHPEHQGRDFDIGGLSEATFDHDQVDFPLLGAHSSTACNDCHEPDVARRDAPSDCYSCHEADDAHDGALSTDCGQCHDEVRWKSGEFDHDETDFPLTGQHAEAACVGCHVGAKYEDTSTDCVSCHSIDDAHGGRFGRDCASCHQTSGWKKKGFDHQQESGFPLIGAHSKTDCATCHREPPGQRTLPEDCFGCHATEDVHGGRFDERCSDCHTSQSWAKRNFDHDRETDFPLRGAHKKQDCDSCHSGPTRNAPADAPCIACHKADDVHRTALGEDCADCHGEDSFKSRIAFDHDLTEFPLLGLHAIASCEDCHSDHTFQLEDARCVTCHAREDVHDRALGTQCHTCHNPNAWDVWRFDHDKQTEFALHGAHDDLECAACHNKPVGVAFQMAQDCVECHGGDDVHRGGFGKNCDNCHSSKAWTPANLTRR